MLNEAFPGFKVPVSSEQMGDFIANFYLQGAQYFNGQVIPVSIGSHVLLNIKLDCIFAHYFIVLLTLNSVVLKSRSSAG